MKFPTVEKKALRNYYNPSLPSSFEQQMPTVSAIRSTRRGTGYSRDRVREGSRINKPAGVAARRAPPEKYKAQGRSPIRSPLRRPRTSTPDKLTVAQSRAHKSPVIPYGEIRSLCLYRIKSQRQLQEYEVQKALDMEARRQEEEKERERAAEQEITFVTYLSENLETCFNLIRDKLLSGILATVREVKAERRRKKEVLQQLDKTSREGQTEAKRLKAELKEDKKQQELLKNKAKEAGDAVSKEESTLLSCLEKKMNGISGLSGMEQELLDWFITMKPQIQSYPDALFEDMEGGDEDSGASETEGDERKTRKKRVRKEISNLSAGRVESEGDEFGVTLDSVKEEFATSRSLRPWTGTRDANNKKATSPLFANS